MWRLVSPDRVLHIIQNEDDLKAAVPFGGTDAKALKERRQLLGNLRQLLGWSSVGNFKFDKIFFHNL